MCDIRLASKFVLERSSLEVPEDTPFDVCGTREVHGILEQRNTLDQFHNRFLALKVEYETPSAMCGYFSIANAVLASKELPRRRILLREELNEVFSRLEDVDAVSAEAEKVMSFLQESRRDYINKHSARFESSSVTIPQYQSDWVANYEISDFLKMQAANGVLLDTVHFFRYNQMPELGTAEHEERDRLEEERCFGSALPGSKGDKQSAPLESGATRFIVERFLPPREGLLRPEHWIQDLSEDSAPPVFVVDVNGHFVISVPLRIKDSPESLAVPTLVVINTTKARYLDNPALVYLFDLAFGEKVVLASGENDTYSCCL